MAFTQGGPGGVTLLTYGIPIIYFFHIFCTQENKSKETFARARGRKKTETEKESTWNTDWINKLEKYPRIRLCPKKAAFSIQCAAGGATEDTGVSPPMGTG